MKKIIPLLVILVFSLTSCFYPQKINKWVAKKYPDAQFKPLRSKPDYITITSPLVKKEQRISTTKQQVKNFLPLIVWWQYDCINTCTLNPNIGLNIFNAALQSHARSKAIEKKLNGQKLTLSVEALPNTFQLIDKGRVIFPIVGWNMISLRPSDSTIKVAWTLSGTDVQSKTGTVTLNSSYKGLPVRLFQPLRGTTWKYLDGYEADLKNLAKQLVEQVVIEDVPAVASAQ